MAHIILEYQPDTRFVLGNIADCSLLCCTPEDLEHRRLSSRRRQSASAHHAFEGQSRRGINLLSDLIGSFQRHVNHINELRARVGRLGALGDVKASVTEESTERIWPFGGAHKQAIVLEDLYYGR